VVIHELEHFLIINNRQIDWLITLILLLKNIWIIHLKKVQILYGTKFLTKTQTFQSKVHVGKLIFGIVMYQLQTLSRQRNKYFLLTSIEAI